MKVAHIGSLPFYLQGKHYPLTDITSDYQIHHLCHELLSDHPDIIQLEGLEDYVFSWDILFSFLRSFRKPVVWILQKENFLKNPFFLQQKELFRQFPRLYIIATSQYLLEKVNHTFLAEHPCLYIPQGVGEADLSWITCQAFSLLFYSENWMEEAFLLERLFPYIPEKTLLLIAGKNSSIFHYSPRCETFEKIDDTIWKRTKIYVDIEQKESFPVLSAQALLHNIPVFTFRNHGREEVACEVFEKDDYSSFQQKILDYQTWFIQDKERISPYEKSREYSLSTAVIRYDMLYQVILEKE